MSTYWLKAKIHGKEVFMEITHRQLKEFKNLPNLEVNKESINGTLKRKLI